MYGEDRPEHAKAIRKFQKQIARAYRELVVAIHPEMKESKKKQKSKRD
jgi:hypothetical protein